MSLNKYVVHVKKTVQIVDTVSETNLTIHILWQICLQFPAYLGLLSFSSFTLKTAVVMELSLHILQVCDFLHVTHQYHCGFSGA